MLRMKEKSGKTRPQEQLSAAMMPQRSRNLSAVDSVDVDEHVGPAPEEASPTRDLTYPAMCLGHDSFAELVNKAINNPKSPGIPSTQLPEDLQIDTEFNDRGQELSTWTCTPSANVPSDEIPLLVDGHPVVLPVEYKYPLTGMFSPPPDPHPHFISPSTPLSDEDIHHIFCTFPACVGFYLLINGFLQVIMPKGFDYEGGVHGLPSEFGGLKVSLIPDTVRPTAGEASASSPSTTTTSTRTAFERIFGQSSSQGAVAGSAGTPGSAGNSPANALRISVGCAVRAIVPSNKSKQRFEGKTGVAISPRDDS
ncbi:hypothetical protein F5883DRAFT_172996 [Diaporthe sp. PMI_573]|nr:hypothetical protein F5883DRAFT_172996 [Diaporthaceae sp. PMI_573]